MNQMIRYRLTDYWVGDDGSIWRLTDKGFKRLNGWPHERSGHLRVRLYCLGMKLCDVYVHAIVAECYHGKRPDGLDVLHGDGDCLNNRPENLRYGTELENQMDRKFHAYSSAWLWARP